MNFRRFFAVIKARNLEFFRDRASLAWNLAFPILLLVGFAFIFSGNDKALYKVGVIGQNSTSHQYSSIKHVDFVSYASLDKALLKLQQHNIDLVIELATSTYWINEMSAKSYMIERVFVAEQPNFNQKVVQGKPIRYVDWVLPGIIGMNMMFSSLFGVGYVIVRYRKNAVLKRLKATPLTASEFVSAQLVSRLFIVMAMSSVIYIGCNFLFDFYMLGSFFDLIIVALLGAASMITLGLLVASRSKSEELIGGLLNLASWPMMMLSGVWFSLEGAPNFMKVVADFLPLTHLVAAARKIMIEGATLAELSYHLTILSCMTVAFLALGAYFFSWNTER